MTTLGELERLEKAATPGTWDFTNDGQIASYSDHPLPDKVLGDTDWSIDDEQLVVAARNALPELLRIARAVVDNGEYDREGYCRMGCDGSGAVYETHADDCAYVLARKLAGGTP